jgi:hypothetical protein
VKGEAENAALQRGVGGAPALKKVRRQGMWEGTTTGRLGDARRWAGVGWATGDRRWGSGVAPSRAEGTQGDRATVRGGVR